MLNLLLHPLRMRIVQTLIGDRQLTAQEISERLPDTAPASLYRHLSILVKGGILTVVEENRKRGTLERVYAITQSLNEETEKEAVNMSREELLRHFFSFQLNLLGDFKAYLDRETIDLHKDGVGYRQVNLYLSDAEFAALADSMNAGIAPLLQNEPAPGRRLRSMATIIVPKE